MTAVGLPAFVMYPVAEMVLTEDVETIQQHLNLHIPLLLHQP
jgi:hypothetical protein